MNSIIDTGSLNLDILAFGSCLGDEVRDESWSHDPKLRTGKATRNMCAAAISADRCLADVPTFDRANCGLILGSVLGEFSATKDFLQTHYAENLSRPLLFQNSLHNATTGFLAIRHGLRGPQLTVSNGPQTFVDCLEAARLLLESRKCDLCLISKVDLTLPELLKDLPPPAQNSLRQQEGSLSLLVAKTNSRSAANPLPSIASITELAREAREIPPERSDKNEIEDLLTRFFDNPESLILHRALVARTVQVSWRQTDDTCVRLGLRYHS